ncbi:MAG: 50S ribosomal protein L23 [Alphaproteobacteria bacterium]|nr:50S ribosomal protein L23 [Alphaproteobacteria bacterium]
MKIQDILIKPILTEKSNSLAEGKVKKYCFKVNKQSTKFQIKLAIEKFYGIKVLDVHTLITADKSKSKMTKKGIYKGVKPSYKKAIISVSDDQNINLYNETV